MKKNAKVRLWKIGFEGENGITVGSGAISYIVSAPKIKQAVDKAFKRSKKDGYRKADLGQAISAVLIGKET